MEPIRPCGSDPTAKATPADGTAGTGKILVISTESLGRGDEELGRILVRSLLNALAEGPTLPEKIVLLNGGVRLTCEQDDTVEALAKLSARGVEVMACGTCLKHFGLLDKLGAGKVSNAHEILAVTLGVATLPGKGMRLSEDFGKTWQNVSEAWEAGGEVLGLSVANDQHVYTALLEGMGENISIWQGKPGELVKVTDLPAGPQPMISFWIPSEPAADRPWYASLGSAVWKHSSRRKGALAKTEIISGSNSEKILALAGMQEHTRQILFALTGQSIIDMATGSHGRWYMTLAASAQYLWRSRPYLRTIKQSTPCSWVEFLAKSLSGRGAPLLQGSST